MIVLIKPVMAKRILYTVLNWGLGHATRSSVIIEALLKEGYEPVIASDGLALEWLQKSFPHLQFLSLPAYNIRYARDARLFWLKLLSQSVQLQKAWRAEHELVQQWAKTQSFDGIISDNRLGCYHQDLPAVYISHQLQLQAGLFTKAASTLHRRFINRYDQLWVPDYTDHRLAGKLSESTAIKIPTHFLGALSRLKDLRSTEGKYYLFLLSGPEPQRSILEQKILDQVAKLSEKAILVRGTNRDKLRVYPEGLQVIDLAGPERLEQLMAEAKVIICRSGYSSIMDLYKLAKKALFIPTPGQTEQQYLARHLAPQFLSVEQNQLQLAVDIPNALVKDGFSRNSQKEDQTNWAELFSLF
jgi:uncharacterized protein (TIGR00661 family)